MHNAHINTQGILTLNLGILPSELVIGDKLGTGGFGTVYKGQRKHNAVAIKELDIRGQVSEKVLDEFKKEALIMAQLGLQCPQLVRLIGVCFEQPYRIVMELLMRGSLYDVLRSGSLGTDWLRWKETISIARDVAIGLEFLHENGVIHRDIKSLNVLLDQHLSAKISDYGLAKIKQTSSRSSSAKSAVGTLPWMAPELLSEDEPQYSFASDIYGYGQVLWEMAMHRDPKTPFASAKNAALIMKKIIMGPLEPIPPETPEYFSSLIEKCRANNPSARPTTAYIIDELTRALNAATARPRIQELEAGISGLSVSPQHSGNISTASTQPVTSGSGLLLFSSASTQPPAAPRTPSPRPYIISPRTHQETAKFLKHVGFGEQDEAEAMLLARPNLATLSGDLTDCAGRHFENITGFQYAVWALDYHMWTMIRKHLDIDHARIQITGLNAGSWISTHGRQISWKPLIEVLDTYVKNYNGWNWETCNNHWCKQVGGAQLILPAHVINEYSHPSRPLYPCPKWNGQGEAILPRTGVADWRTGGYGGELGRTFAWGRGGGYAQQSDITVDWGYDHAACVELLKSRTEQAQALISELTPRPAVRPQP